MFDVPIDSWYAWLGIATVSVLAFGTVASLPTAPPPDATSAAAAVDRTATSHHDATAEIPIDAEKLRLGRNQVGLRTDGGSSHASFVYGPVAPIRGSSPLEAVLRGSPPSREFASPAALANASARAGTSDPAWRSTTGTLLVRHVFWGDIDVTLVGQQ